MRTMIDHRKNFIFAMLLGAVVGGLFVTLATKAFPKMMTQMMTEMMQNMMTRMSESGCDPSEM